MLKTLNEEELKEISAVCKKLRSHIVKMIHNAKSGHPGGSLSAIEILTVLYTKVMNHYPDWDKNPNFEKRDRFASISI